MKNSFLDTLTELLEEISDHVTNNQALLENIKHILDDLVLIKNYQGSGEALIEGILPHSTKLINHN